MNRNSKQTPTVVRVVRPHRVPVVVFCEAGEPQDAERLAELILDSFVFLFLRQERDFGALLFAKQLL